MLVRVGRKPASKLFCLFRIIGNDRAEVYRVANSDRARWCGMKT